MKEPTQILLYHMETKFNEPINRIILSNAMFRCTKCGGIKSMAEFGKLRVTTDGTARNQAQCKSCRFRYKSLTGETNGQDT